MKQKRNQTIKRKLKQKRKLKSKNKFIKIYKEILSNIIVYEYRK